MRVAFWLKAEHQVVEDFGRLPEPVFPETIEDWLGHRLTLGLTPKELTDLRAKLDDMRRGSAGMRNRRLDGKPRKRTPPAARPSTPRMK